MPKQLDIATTTSRQPEMVAEGRLRISAFWPWIVLVCTFSELMTIFSAGESIGSPIIQRHKKSRHIKQYLETLTADELSVLKYYSESRKTHWFKPNDGVVQNLIKEGILYCSSELPDGGGCCAYTLPRDAEHHVRQVLKTKLK